MAKDKIEKKEVHEENDTQEAKWDAFWETYKKQNPVRATRIEAAGEIGKHKQIFLAK